MLKKILYALLSAVLWIGLWELIYWVVHKEILVVSPFRVLSLLGNYMTGADFWLTCLYSLLRIMIGLLLGVILGVILAAVTSMGQAAGILFKPIYAIIVATPVVSFILLARVWIATDLIPVFISFLMVLPIIWSNISAGIGKIDAQLLEMARVFRLGRRKTLGRVAIPSVMPYFVAGISSGLGLAWKAGIAAEVLCVPAVGIGSRLYQAKLYFNTADLFAWTTTVIFLSILLTYFLTGLMTRIGRKYNLEARSKRSAVDAERAPEGS